jgi:hypothetical protein
VLNRKNGPGVRLAKIILNGRGERLLVILYDRSQGCCWHVLEIQLLSELSLTRPLNGGEKNPDLGRYLLMQFRLHFSRSTGKLQI